MAKKRGENRPGSRTSTRPPVVDDEDDDDQNDDAMSDAELLAQIRSAAGRNNGNAEAVALGYLRDIRRIRKVKNKWEKAYNDLLEEMPEGSLVLVGDEADAVRGIIEARKLDPKKLVDLFNKLESDLATANAKILEYDGKLLFSRIAENTGYTKEAIEAAVKNGNYHVEEREIEVDGSGADKGKKVKKMWPFVRPKADDKAALVKFDEAIDKDQKYMWPALRSGAPQQNGRSSGTTTAVVDGTSAPREGTSGESNPVKESLERDKERAKKQGNPLDFLKAPSVAARP